MAQRGHTSPFPSDDLTKYTDLCDVFKIAPQQDITQEFSTLTTTIASAVAAAMIIEACVSSDAKDGVRLRQRMTPAKNVMRDHKVLPKHLPAGIKKAYDQAMEMT
ncbi:unnamed protein product, partial [Prorocentrum cordatum]